MSRKYRLGLTIYQYAAGLCDMSTGLLLVFAPAWTLHLMGISVPPQPIEFTSFIGVFVFSVGLTYFWVALIWPLSAASIPTWQTQWLITALIRILVALFLLSEIASGRMEPRWIVVALSDGVLALIQWYGLCRGWLKLAQ